MPTPPCLTRIEVQLQRHQLGVARMPVQLHQNHPPLPCQHTHLPACNKHAHCADSAVAVVLRCSLCCNDVMEVRGLFQHNLNLCFLDWPLPVLTQNLHSGGQLCRHSKQAQKPAEAALALLWSVAYHTEAQQTHC